MTDVNRTNSTILDDCKVFRDVIVYQLPNNKRRFTELDCLLFDISYSI